MKQDLTGRRFGKITVVSRNPQLEDRYYTWNCQCDCGRQIVVNTKRLTRGTVTNCGCVPKTKYQRSIDLTGEVFGPLRDKNLFIQFALTRMTIEWVNGADLAPEFLYDIGKTVERKLCVAEDAADYKIKPSSNKSFIS